MGVTAILSEEGVGQREKVKRDKKRRLTTVVGRNPPKVYYGLGLGQSAWVRSGDWEPSAAVGGAMVKRLRPSLGNSGRQHRQIPVYTWLVVVDDDEFLRVVIRDFTIL